MSLMMIVLSVEPLIRYLAPGFFYPMHVFIAVLGIRDIIVKILFLQAFFQFVNSHVKG